MSALVFEDPPPVLSGPIRCEAPSIHSDVRKFALICHCVPSTTVGAQYHDVAIDARTTVLILHQRHPLCFSAPSDEWGLLALPSAVFDTVKAKRTASGTGTQLSFICLYLKKMVEMTSQNILLFGLWCGSLVCSFPGPYVFLLS